MAFSTHTTSMGCSLEHMGVKLTMSLKKTEAEENTLQVLSGASPLRNWLAMGLGII